MAAQIESHILVRLGEENGKMKTWLEERFKLFQDQTGSQLKSIENMIHSK